MAKKLGTSLKNISCLELHLNVKNGNCLLVYSKNNNEVLLINISTHNQFFKNGSVSNRIGGKILEDY